MRKKKDEIQRILSVHLRRIFDAVQVDFDGMQEIRLRVGQPVQLRFRGREYFLKENGELSESAEGCYLLPVKEVRETLEYIGNFSLYAFEDEVRQGFITVQGGHRIGIAGKAVMQDGRIKTVKNISFLHIRLAHEIAGCGEDVLPFLFEPGTGELYHTMILSPPGCGKTTLLRDMIRLLSDGGENREGLCVGVVDERSEIAACYMGIPQNDLGIRTDVLDCCPKADGMMMLIRSMAPQVVAVDEVGSSEEMKAVGYAMHCGCRMLVTAHGRSFEEIRSKLGAEQSGGLSGFERFLILSRRRGPGTVEAVLNADGKSVINRKML